jgi:hypothetical protein
MSWHTPHGDRNNQVWREVGEPLRRLLGHVEGNCEVSIAGRMKAAYDRGDVTQEVPVVARERVDYHSVPVLLSFTTTRFGGDD